VTTYATVGDLLIKRPDLTSAQQASALADLEEGSALLRRSIPGLDDGLAAGTIDPILVRKVLRDAVLRVLRNPAGVTTQVIGPESATFSGLAQRAELAFLDSELAMITPASDGVSVGGFAIGSFRVGRPGYCGTAPTFVSERWC
jgi:hypothetical protein